MNVAPASYRNKYEQMFNAIQVKPDVVKQVNTIAKKIIANKSRYEGIEKLTGVKWYMIGLIHNLESGNNFNTHLHNGDPLTSRTVNYPPGRPISGNPPFTFEESAVDAIEVQQLDKWKDWSIGGILFKLEEYNGPGYRNIGAANPYLWSGSQYYVKGKFIKDHVYDKDAVSKQIGAATILYVLMKEADLLSDNSALKKKF